MDATSAAHASLKGGNAPDIAIQRQTCRSRKLPYIHIRRVRVKGVHLVAFAASSGRLGWLTSDQRQLG
jgi:hypothetical protein